MFTVNLLRIDPESTDAGRVWRRHCVFIIENKKLKGISIRLISTRYCNSEKHKPENLCKKMFCYKFYLIIVLLLLQYK